MSHKILFINSLYFPYIGGGAEIICQEQVEAFRDRGYDVVVLTTAAKGSEITTDEVNGVKVYRAGIKNLYWHFDRNKPNKYKKMAWHIRDMYNSAMKDYLSNVIRLEKPDVVVCHNITGFSIAIWDEIKKHNLPIVQVLHDQYLRCINSNAFNKGKECVKQCLSCRAMRLLHKQKSNKVDVVVGVSHFVLNSLVDAGYFQESKKVVIHNARNIPEIGIKDAWNGEEPLRIGYIGTLSKVKGVEWLIRSFMSLEINATLTIAGKGESLEYENFLKKLAELDKRIFFSGYVKASEHYARIHLSVVPSLWPDTFPTVAFESCANHVPVIATKVGGLPEIIKDGVNGLIFNPNDEFSLEKVILHLTKNPDLLTSLTKASRDSVSTMLSAKQMIDSYILHLNNLNLSIS